MKQISLSLAIILISFQFAFGQKSPYPLEIKKLPKKVRPYLKDMVYLKGGSVTVTPNIRVIPLKKDTSLIIDNFSKKNEVKDFLLLNHEVTNREYKDFLKWVRRKRVLEVACEFLPQKYPLVDGEIPYDLEVDFQDNELKLILIQEGLIGEFNLYTNHKFTYHLSQQNKDVLIFPDTLAWLKDFPIAYNQPMSDNYFWHPAYDNYPVVGVSYYQTLAYCDWLTNLVNMEILVQHKVLKKRSWNFSVEAFRKDPKNKEYLHLLLPPFRLPSEKEWNYAAQAQTLISAANEEGMAVKKYRANYGSSMDQNYLVVKSYVDDGGFHTLPSHKYNAKGDGVSGLLGNVAEWTSTVYSPELSFQQYESVEIPKSLYYFKNNNEEPAERFIYTNKDDVNAIISTYDSLSLSSSYNGKQYAADSLVFKHFHQRLLHNTKVAEGRKLLMVVKGGSWASTLIYLQPYTKEVCAPDQTRSTIGFRIAM